MEVKPIITVQQGPDGTIHWTEEAMKRMQTSRRLGPYMAVALDGGAVDLNELRAALRSENIEIVMPRIAWPQAPALPGARIVEGKPAAPAPAPAPAAGEAPPVAGPPATKGIALTKKQVIQLLSEVDLRLLLDVAGARLSAEMEEQFPGCELAMVVDTESGLYVSISIPPEEQEEGAAEGEERTEEGVTLAMTKAGTPFDKLGSATAQVFQAAVPTRDKYLAEVCSGADI